MTSTSIDHKVIYIKLLVIGLMAQARHVARERQGGQRPARLLYLIKRWYSATRARLDEITRKHNLTAGDYTMLSFLKRLEPCSAAELSREQRITPQAATQQIAQLKAKGMVTAQEKEANRRISLISMTADGRETLAAINSEARALEEEILAGFTPEQKDLLLALMARSVDLAEERQRSDDPRLRV
ncbi:MarR family winged helix-turn-helix transcriptional regulator [Sphingosinicella sp. CPCC 101087]|uniref:MarR family winged helix-turn-helix transcriptional regulator n=1 Tax=Sphingosinicella sp. CPCC 101087 TaxID=2497754 RepID=UPI0013EC21CA|nr:MarR family transcriptional regulator [Sphingosinicella sp. CPCC 101087]